MHYFDESREVAAKVMSAHPKVAEINGELYGVLECKISEPLTEEEIKVLNVKKNKNDFEKLINMMTPLINKYTRLLYKDEKEDINSELILALWERIIIQQ